ncbi:MAG: MBL fold metallo-hydrolase [Solirubrobacteraceae bacterium]
MIEAPPLLESDSEEVSPGVHVIPDRRVEFVPNAGVLVGERATLAVETAMGAANGRRMLQHARRLGGARKLLLTTTHFHPEHAFGVEPLRAEAVYVANAAQAAELADKGDEYVEMFRGFGPGLAEVLQDVELCQPDVTYDGGLRLDLGGLAVELIEIGPAHTRGDQVVFLPESRVLFAGDLVEHRFLPIFPDPDANGPLWLAALDRLSALDPAIVVGGHGAVGGPELIDALRGYMVSVRDRVRELASAGSELGQIEETLEPELLGSYGDWGNQEWVKSAIGSFHSALSS